MGVDSGGGRGSSFSRSSGGAVGDQRLRWGGEEVMGGDAVDSERGSSSFWGISGMLVLSSCSVCDCVERTQDTGMK